MRGATEAASNNHNASYISTHTPHAGRDGCKNASDVFILSTFLLTRPMRGATSLTADSDGSFIISTHTPHAGRDVCLVEIISLFAYFYSHAPCGARLMKFLAIRRLGAFLLTRPMRGATRRRRINGRKITISTHTPHAGRDETLSGLGSLGVDFYSHAPCGARPKPMECWEGLIGNFYSHAPCGARRSDSHRSF